MLKQIAAAEERSLIAFTLLTQMAVGAFWTLAQLEGAAPPPSEDSFTGMLAALGPLIALGVLASLRHLSVPLNAWRSLFNLRSSWLSREILCVGLFAAGWAATSAARWLDAGGMVVAVLYNVTTLAGLALIYSMARVYMLRTVPAWNTWVTPVSFLMTALALGPLTVAALLAAWPGLAGDWQHMALTGLTPGITLQLAFTLLVGCLWPFWLRRGPESARRAADLLLGKYRPLYINRAMLLFGASLAAGSYTVTAGGARPGWFVLAFGLALAGEIIGRYLFYETNIREGV